MSQSAGNNEMLNEMIGTERKKLTGQDVYVRCLRYNMLLLNVLIFENQRDSKSTYVLFRTPSEKNVFHTTRVWIKKKSTGCFLKAASFCLFLIFADIVNTGQRQMALNFSPVP